MLRVQPSRSESQHTCPLCRDDLGGGEHQACTNCETVYHPACLGELGGCSTLGCALKGKLPDSLPNWFCRACHQPIESDLTRRNCRCGAYLHDSCVEAHAASCERATELRRQTGRPHKRDHDVPSVEELRVRDSPLQPAGPNDVAFVISLVVLSLSAIAIVLIEPLIQFLMGH